MISQFIFPIIFVSLSAGLFFTYIDSAYENVQEIIVKDKSFDEALIKAKEVQEVKDNLLNQYNSFSISDLEKLEKFLPDNVDNVRLILDIDTIALAHGMRIENVVFATDSGRTVPAGTVDSDNSMYSFVDLSFTVHSPYEGLKNFIIDLERSLRVVDIRGIELNPRQRESSVDTNPNLFTYKIALRTYWLK